MNVMVDENLPPAMARALAALFVHHHEVRHLRERFGAGTTDMEWMNRLNAEGSWVVLSADRQFSRNRAEQRVFRSSRLIAFIFAPSLQKASTVKKMERLMATWETIEKQVPLVRGGSVFEIPMRGDRLRPL